MRLCPEGDTEELEREWYHHRNSSHTNNSSCLPAQTLVVGQGRCNAMAMLAVVGVAMEQEEVDVC